MSEKVDYAFPGEHLEQDSLPNSSTGRYQSWPVKHGGMTLRDYFAGQALGVLNLIVDGNISSSTENAAKFAYDMADAMLKERSKP